MVCLKTQLSTASSQHSWTGPVKEHHLFIICFPFAQVLKANHRIVWHWGTPPMWLLNLVNLKKKTPRGNGFQQIPEKTQFPLSTNVIPFSINIVVLCVTPVGHKINLCLLQPFLSKIIWIIGNTLNFLGLGFFPILHLAICISFPFNKCRSCPHSLKKSTATHWLCRGWSQFQASLNTFSWK